MHSQYAKENRNDGSGDDQLESNPFGMKAKASHIPGNDGRPVVSSAKKPVPAAKAKPIPKKPIREPVDGEEEDEAVDHRKPMVSAPKPAMSAGMGSTDDRPIKGANSKPSMSGPSEGEVRAINEKQAYRGLKQSAGIAKESLIQSPWKSMKMSARRGQIKRSGKSLTLQRREW